MAELQNSPPPPDAVGAPGIDARPLRLIQETFAVLAVSISVLMAAFVFVDNTTMLTGNGLWKSIEVKKWTDADPEKKLQPPNLLYFPVYGWLTAQLPESTFGPVWHRMAFLNVCFGGLSAAFLYLLMRGLLPAMNSFYGVLMQLGCAFYLGLSISNEDIMPGLSFLVSSLAAAVWVAKKPTFVGVALVAALFTLGWLFEWRLMFPTIGPMVLALFVLDMSWNRTLAMLAVAVLTAFVIVAISVSLLPPRPTFWWSVGCVVWTGKGIGSGWAGFNWHKPVFLMQGVSQYFVGGKNWMSLDLALEPSNLTWVFVKFAMMGLVGAVFAHRVWRMRRQSDWRTAGILLFGTLVCGQVFNTYAQPQDPQFQINAMLCLPVAWAAFTAAFNSIQVRRPVFSTIVLAVLSLLPLLLNLRLFAEQRGGDARSLAAVADIESKFDPSRTVFVDQLGGIVTWQAVLWDFRPKEQESRGPAPQPTPKYKFILVHQEASEHPKRSPDESAASVCKRIDDALADGYTVLIGPLWEWSERQFVDSFSTITGQDKPQAIYRALKSKYDGTPVFENETTGRYYALTAKRGV